MDFKISPCYNYAWFKKSNLHKSTHFCSISTYQTQSFVPLRHQKPSYFYTQSASLYSLALYRNVVSGIPHSFAAFIPVISPALHRRQSPGKFSGNGFGGRPKRTPRALAALIPSACLCRMFDRSFSATNESTCNTISAKKAPIKSFPRRVSNSGISTTTMSAPLSFVILRQCCRISS